MMKAETENFILHLYFLFYFDDYSLRFTTHESRAQFPIKWNAKYCVKEKTSFGIRIQIRYEITELRKYG